MDCRLRTGGLRRPDDRRPPGARQFSRHDRSRRRRTLVGVRRARSARPRPVHQPVLAPPGEHGLQRVPRPYPRSARQRGLRGECLGHSAARCCRGVREFRACVGIHDRDRRDRSPWRAGRNRALPGQRPPGALHQFLFHSARRRGRPPRGRRRRTRRRLPWQGSQRRCRARRRRDCRVVAQSGRRRRCDWCHLNGAPVLSRRRSARRHRPHASRSVGHPAVEQHPLRREQKGLRLQGHAARGRAAPARVDVQRRRARHRRSASPLRAPSPPRPYARSSRRFPDGSRPTSGS